MQLLDQIPHLRFPAPLPKTLLEVRQTFDAPRVDDVPLAVRKALEAGGLLAKIKPGDSVAVGVCLRGIANISQIARMTVDRLKEYSARMQIFAVEAQQCVHSASPEAFLAAATMGTFSYLLPITFQSTTGITEPLRSAHFRRASPTKARLPQMHTGSSPLITASSASAKLGSATALAPRA